MTAQTTGSGTAAHTELKPAPFDTVVVEVPGRAQRRILGRGDAIVVPRGLWHRIDVERPASLVHLTPGPSGEHRPLRPEHAGGPT